jgi:hypothetical protein
MLCIYFADLFFVVIINALMLIDVKGDFIDKVCEALIIKRRPIIH